MTKETETQLRVTARRVAYKYNLSYEEITAKTRIIEVVKPRQIAMYLMYKNKMPYIRIAEFFKMNHATVMHAIKIVQDDMDIYPSIKKEVKELMSLPWKKEKYFEKNSIIYCLPCEIFTTFTKQ